MFLDILFWSSVFFIIYPYIIYPFLLIVFNKIKPIVSNEEDYSLGVYEPYVTVLIPAYNEADVIEDTIVNKLGQIYPKDKLEIIVISDESIDGTDDIVKKYKNEGVQLIRQVPRRGKAAALNHAVKLAKGEIIVFSDANSIFDEFAIKNIVSNYRGSDIGYTTGNLTYTSEKEGISEDGVSAYIKYENKVRKLESIFQSVIGVNGGVDSVRKKLYKDVPDDLITDFVLPMHVMDQGYRVVYDSAIMSSEQANDNVEAELKMRTRVALRAIRGLIYMKHLLNPIRSNPRISFSLISHKVIRYMGPVFLLSAFISNLILSFDSVIYTTILTFHGFLYAISILCIKNMMPLSINKLVVVPAYFVLSNAAFLVAFIRLFRGDKMATWNPRES